jgi:hypothetical protein
MDLSRSSLGALGIDPVTFGITVPIDSFSDDDDGVDISTLMRHLQFCLCDLLPLFLELRGDLCCLLSAMTLMVLSSTTTLLVAGHPRRACHSIISMLWTILSTGYNCNIHVFIKCKKGWNPAISPGKSTLQVCLILSKWRQADVSPYFLLYEWVNVTVIPGR